MTEKELIQKAKKNNRQAMAELYKQYKNVWFMICLRYNKNKQDAEDCLQNALVKIFSKLNLFDPEKGEFKHWSATVVRNTNLEYLKNKKQLFSDDYIDERMYVSETEQTFEPILSQENLVNLVQQLPIGYRTVFNLYVMEGYIHKEIAEILDISVGTSKSQLAKAKKMLRDQLSKALISEKE